jgi:hypothetical protein
MIERENFAIKDAAGWRELQMRGRLVWSVFFRKAASA